ncbi:hypothetical protein E2320_022801, partial [Naja naja]
MKISNPDGTCSLNSSLEMMATEDINFSMFLCLVQHDSQSPVNEMSMLFITEQLERKPALKFKEDSMKSQTWQNKRPRNEEPGGFVDQKLGILLDLAKEHGGVPFFGGPHLHKA